MSLPLATSDVISRHILFKMRKFCFATTQPSGTEAGHGKARSRRGMAWNMRLGRKFLARAHLYFSGTACVQNLNTYFININIKELE